MKANGSAVVDAPSPPFGSNRSGLNSFGSENMDGFRNATKSVRARLESAGIIRPSSGKTIWSQTCSAREISHAYPNECLLRCNEQWQELADTISSFPL